MIAARARWFRTEAFGHGRRREKAMRWTTRLLGVAAAAALTVTTASGVASADVTGPQAFEFAGTCTGLGDVFAEIPSRRGDLGVGVAARR